jgi:hypothetical protein
MTRIEAVWILSLSLLLLWIILASRNSDLSQANERLVNQHMEYLAGQLRFKMDQRPQDVDPWPDFLVGPGAVPSTPEFSQSAPLQTLLPAPIYIPTDPWGSAYIFRKDPEKNVWRIQCQGDQPSTDGLDETAFAQYEIFPPGS